MASGFHGQITEEDAVYHQSHFESEMEETKTQEPLGLHATIRVRVRSWGENTVSARCPFQPLLPAPFSWLASLGTVCTALPRSSQLKRVPPASVPSGDCRTRGKATCINSSKQVFCYLKRSRFPPYVYISFLSPNSCAYSLL